MSKLAKVSYAWGLSETDAYKKETPKGEVIAARVFTAGANAKDVLPGLLQTALEKMAFPKTMRWGDDQIAFARPIQWILALLDDQVLPFQFIDVSTGNTTQGHRFHAPFAREVRSIEDYRAVMALGVSCFRQAREDAIRQQVQQLAKSVGGQWVEDEDLVATGGGGTPLALVELFESSYLEILKKSSSLKCANIKNVLPFKAKIATCCLTSWWWQALSLPTMPKWRRASSEAKARFDDGFYYKLDVQKPDEHAKRLEQVVFQRDLGQWLIRSRASKRCRDFWLMHWTLMLPRKQQH